jgi:hypothetical protein
MIVGAGRKSIQRYLHLLKYIWALSSKARPHAL